MEVHLLDDQQGLHEAGRREARLGPRPAGQPDVDLHRIAGIPGDLKSYGPLTLESINTATPNKPTVQPVPYTGVQFVGIPEFQDLGTRVSQQISAAIAGQISVDDALAQAQQYAEVVGRTYQEK